MLGWISILLRDHLQRLFLCQHLLSLRETEWQGWWALHITLCTKDKEWISLTFQVKKKKEFNIALFEHLLHLFYNLSSMFSSDDWMSGTTFTPAEGTSWTRLIRLQAEPRFLFFIFFSHIYSCKRFFAKRVKYEVMNKTALCNSLFYMTPHEILIILLKASRLTPYLGCLIMTCLKYILN